MHAVGPIELPELYKYRTAEFRAGRVLRFLTVTLRLQDAQLICEIGLGPRAPNASFGYGSHGISAGAVVMMSRLIFGWVLNRIGGLPTLLGSTMQAILKANGRLRAATRSSRMACNAGSKFRFFASRPKLNGVGGFTRSRGCDRPFGSPPRPGSIPCAEPAAGAGASTRWTPGPFFMVGVQNSPDPQ